MAPPKKRSKGGKQGSETPPAVLGSTMLRAMIFCTVCVGLGAVGLNWAYAKYVLLPGRISTKSDLPKVTNESDVDPLVWGTYRSNLYFGLRTRHPKSPLFGLMWYRQPPKNTHQVRMPTVRHWCDQGDQLQGYGWTQHDGRTFGKQTINDGFGIKLQTDWINEGHTWTARIKSEDVPVEGFESGQYSFIMYFAMQESNSYLRPLMDPETGSIAGFNGKSSLLGDFEFDFTVKSKEGVDVSHLLFNDAPFTDVGHLKELVERSTVLVRDEDQLKLKLVGVHEDRPQDGEKPNLIAIQVNVPADTTIDIHFNVGKMRALRGKLFETELEQRSKRFGEKFEAAFGRMKDLPEFYQRMGEAALSNMLGSIGYFHGSNIVQSVHSEKLLKYGPHSLLSGVPSRPFFPRGFLWDEGFHNLLIRKFDQNLSFEIIASWLDTMNIDGWIPREMILGSEAELRVPAEFVVQRDSVANPPMFFYLMNNFLDDADFVKAHEASIKRLYPRLKVWYKWLRTTQSGSKPGAFRWRGRNATTELELNPKTLPSGLDDFPRASHPSDNERHLDLRCWMSFASKVLARLADLAEDWDYLPTIKTEAEALADLENLDKLHWSSAVNRYADFGNHSTKVKLEWRRVDPRNPERIEKRRKTVTPAVEQLVEDANGYLSLFPLMLQMLPADSPNLKLILEGLRDPKEMWSPHGLRSVAKSSPYYLADNTEHDRPYWRGAIWVNMNYMVLSALKQYGSETGPNQQMAHEIYAELRGNLVQNIARQFRKTGYLWEHYDDVDGHGKGSHPFTGWSALVLAIMAERYD